MDDCEDLDPAEIAELYGVHGQPTQRPAGHTGAGYLPDEDPTTPEDDDDEDVVMEPEEEHDIAASSGPGNKDTNRQIQVPKLRSPFEESGLESLFEEALGVAQEIGSIPPGYGMSSDEWVDGEYPSYEVLKVGKKETTIQLPDHIWRPRAELWVRALDIMNSILVHSQS